MAVGNAVLDVILEPGFLEKVEHTSLLLKQRLAELKDRHPGIVEEIRGEGLLIGIKCRVPNTELATAARGQKLLTVPAGDNVLRLLPPLNHRRVDRRRSLRSARWRLRTASRRRR